MKGDGRGGARPGAGRPKGSVKTIHIQRKQRQVRAFDDEWAVIKEFMKNIRVYGVDYGREVLAQFKLKSKS